MRRMRNQPVFACCYLLESEMSWEISDKSLLADLLYPWQFLCEDGFHGVALYRFGRCVLLSTVTASPILLVWIKIRTDFGFASITLWPWIDVLRFKPTSKSKDTEHYMQKVHLGTISGIKLMIESLGSKSKNLCHKSMQWALKGLVQPPGTLKLRDIY